MVELKIGAATIENSMEFPQKTETNISFRNSTAEYILEENENTHSKRDMHPNVHICIMEYYSDIKKMTLCHLQQCGWTWKVLCSVK